jgi:hypothetical protein
VKVQDRVPVPDTGQVLIYELVNEITGFELKITSAYAAKAMNPDPVTVTVVPVGPEEGVTEIVGEVIANWAEAASCETSPVAVTV